MDKSAVKIRLMNADDFDAVVKIDERVLKTSRLEYYKLRFSKFVKSKDSVPTSLVAVDGKGTVVGFVLGELYQGEYGVSHETATLDTIGVDPDWQNQSIGQNLITEFVAHMKSLGVKRLFALVEWNDTSLVHFFSANKFSPSRYVNLERSLY
jgi:predicted N-acetyltransferase YhbS